MKSKFISLLAILLGLIIIMFPVMGVVGIADLISMSVLLISIYLLVVGVAIIDYNKTGAILDLVLGIILLLLSICLRFDPILHLMHGIPLLPNCLLKSIKTGSLLAC